MRMGLYTLFTRDDAIKAEVCAQLIEKLPVRQKSPIESSSGFRVLEGFDFSDEPMAEFEILPRQFAAAIRVVQAVYCGWGRPRAHKAIFQQVMDYIDECVNQLDVLPLDYYVEDRLALLDRERELTGNLRLVAVDVTELTPRQSNKINECLMKQAAALDLFWDYLILNNSKIAADLLAPIMLWKKGFNDLTPNRTEAQKGGAINWRIRASEGIQQQVEADFEGTVLEKPRIFGANRIM